MKTLFEGKKLYAVIIAFLFMIIFFITFHVIRNHYQYVVKDTIAENNLKAYFLSSLMYEHQKAATSILESYAQRLLFIDAVKKKDFHRAIYHLKSLSEHHSEIDALVLYDQYGTIWANYPVSKEGFGKNFAYRDLYNGVSRKWKPYISTVYRRVVQGKGLAVAVAVPVFDRKGKVIGILCGIQHTYSLATLIKENIADPKKNIALLDQEGNIIFSNALPYQEKITKYPEIQVLEKALAGVTANMEIADAKDKDSFSYASIAPVRGIGWSVIVGQEKDAILKQLYGYFILSAATGFVIFLLLTVSLLYFRKEYKYRKTKELLQAEEKYRNIIENAVEGIFQTTLEGRHIIVNPAHARMFGYDSPEDMVSSVVDIGRQLYVNPEQRKEYLRLLDGKGVIKNYEIQVYRKDGSIFWVSLNARVVRDDAGNPLHYEGFVVDITGRKRAEEALRESENQFRVAQELSPDGFTILRPIRNAQDRVVDFTWVYENATIARLNGTDPKAVVGQRLLELFPGHSGSQFLRAYQLVAESGEHCVFEADYCGESMSNPTWFRIAVVPMGGDIAILAQDITERKQAEETLKKSAQLLRDTGEMAKVGGWELDLSTKEVSWTEEVGRIHGVEPGYKPKLEEALNFYAPKSRPALEEALKKATETGEPYDLESLFIPSGSKDKIWIRSLGRAVYSGGKIVRLAGTFQNIDKYKRAEEALRLSEENFRRSLEESPLGVRIVTIEGETIYANRAILDIYGYDSIEDLKTTPVEKRYTPESFAEHQIRKEKRKRGDNAPFEYVIRIIRKDGEIRHLQVFRKEILWDGEKQFQVLYNDITERKQTEEELRTSRSQLRALAVRLQQIREEERIMIAREIHDDMGGGLTGLKMDLSWLLRKMGNADPGEERVALMDKIHTSNASIDQLIRIVRRISTDLRPSILDDLGLIAALEWQLSEFSSRTEILHEFATTFEYVNMKEDTAVAVFRIFQEALTNVVRHSRATKVAVFLREGERSLFGDETLVLEIRDNGRGITEEEIRDSESLGLLGMEERVLTFGGNLSIHGEPDRGTSVILKIPQDNKTSPHA